jgi:hypothetical protein
MPNQTSLTEITSNLDTVHGGAAGRVITNAARATWNAVKPWLGRADRAVETFGKYAGGALAAKEGYDMVTGGNASSGNQPAQSTPPKP